MELESSSIEFAPTPDRRATIPEPLPVRLIAIDDMSSVSVAGLEREMDSLYVEMLQFQRAADETTPDGAHVLVYRADNADLRFTVSEPVIARAELRPIPIEVNSLAELSQKLVEAEIEFSRQKGLMPGRESLLLQDPSGNWIEITEHRAIS